jgi:ribose 5-phosphate isomerase A
MTGSGLDLDRMKRAAAIRAVEEVEDGMVLGLGSGSTMTFALEALAGRVARGLRISGIPTSEATAALARRLGVPLASFDGHRRVDLAIDGADQVQRDRLHLLKGRGGALVREKIVASASNRMIVVVDESKIVDRLGERGRLAAAIVAFGWSATVERLEALGCAPRLRRVAGKPFATDDGHYVADCAVGPIADPAALERRLSNIVGVVETGIFVNLASTVIVGGRFGVTLLERARAR